MTDTAYSTDDPAIVAAFIAARDAGNAFATQVIADAAALGRNKGPLRTSDLHDGTYTTAGLAPDDPTDPPVGWVYSKGRDMLVPRRGKAGDAARRWLDGHQPPTGSQVRAVMAEHGLPLNDMLGAGQNGMSIRFNVPEIAHHDGTLWALYQGTPGSWFGGKDQPKCTWTPRKLSEYYAAREAAEAAEAAVAR
jgi:hypothetical protein